MGLLLSRAGHHYCASKAQQAQCSGAGSDHGMPQFMPCNIYNKAVLKHLGKLSKEAILGPSLNHCQLDASLQ